MSYINLMANDQWSEADIQNRQRAVVASVVPEARQNELRTILLGHLAGMRVATLEELAEVELVRVTTLAAYNGTLAARADMTLLRQVLDVESGMLDPAVVGQDVTALVAARLAAQSP